MRARTTPKIIKRFWYCCLILIWTPLFFEVVFAPEVVAETLVLSSQHHLYRLGKYVDILEDKNEQFTINDVTSLPLAGRFMKSGVDIPNLGVSKSAFWLRFTIKAPEAIAPQDGEEGFASWILDFDRPPTESLILFTPDANRPGRYIFRKPVYRPNGFDLPIVPGQTTTFYIRIKSHGASLFIPIKLFTSDVHRKKNNTQMLIYGVYFGTILTILFYNLFLFISLRDQSYLWYILHMAFIGLYFMLINLDTSGYAQIGPSGFSDGFRFRMGILSIAACGIVLFTRNFLLTRQNAPRVDYALLVLLAICISLFLVNFFISPSVTNFGFIMVGIFSPALLICIGIIRLRQGFRPARFFLISEVVYVSGIFIFALTLQGVLPFTVMGFHAMQIGSGLEAILLSLALADRIQVLRDQKQTAEAATAAKSKFLAGMSHEIRTPMNAIIGMADLLSESPLNSEQQKYVRIFRNAGENLLDIINDILDLSKVEAGLIELEQIPFDLAELVLNANDIMTFKADEKGLELNTDIAAEVPVYLLGDPVRLRQILINLMGNAVKFTHAGNITLTVACYSDINTSSERDSVELVFHIKDSGIGIPADKQADIFESFTQADTSTTRNYGGSGLGLNICKQLTEMMAGDIWVESEPGQGSTFSFTARFDINPTPPTKQQPEPALPEKTVSLSAMNILLVEDAEENQFIIKAYLKEQPHVITIAENGQEAVEQFMAKPFDLVLMDIQMPVMDGYDATRAIRKWEVEASRTATPILALTAHALAADLQKCIYAGCNDYLSKPIKKADLLTAIAKYAVSD